MTQNRYEHLRPAIEEFFRKQGQIVRIEPRGSRGPDLEGEDPRQLVAEIKAASETQRDLPGYWSQWNSAQQFGGKSRDYRLRDDLPPEAEDLSVKVQGWLAVVFGQLRHYVRTAGASAGWLVVERYDLHRQPLEDALEFLVSAGRLRNYSVHNQGQLGMVCIVYR